MPITLRSGRVVNVTPMQPVIPAPAPAIPAPVPAIPAPAPAIPAPAPAPIPAPAPAPFIPAPVPFIPPPAPAGWPTARSYYLAEGLRIALDYVNLPLTAAGSDQHMRNKRAARAHATRARRWARNWYKVSKGTPYSASTTPNVVHAPAITLARAAAGYNFRDRDIEADTAQIIASQRNLSNLYDSIWFVGGAGVPPVRRVLCTWVFVPGGPARPVRQFYDHSSRMACRNAANGFPSVWNGANGITGLEDAAIRAVDAGIVTVAGGHPKVAGIGAFMPPVLGGPPGHLMERLPEFLCQLGARRVLTDFN